MWSEGEDGYAGRGAEMLFNSSAMKWIIESAPTALAANSSVKQSRYTLSKFFI